MITDNPEYKKRLEEAVKKLNPDGAEFWKNYTLENIPGINYSIKNGLKMRKEHQKEWGFRQLGDYIWATNRELYEKLKKDGYAIVFFNPKYDIP